MDTAEKIVPITPKDIMWTLHFVVKHKMGYNLGYDDQTGEFIFIDFKTKQEVKRMPFASRL